MHFERIVSASYSLKGTLVNKYFVQATTNADLGLDSLSMAIWYYPLLSLTLEIFSIR